MSAGQLDAGGGVFRLSLIDDLAKPLANSLTGAVSTTYKATQLIDNELQKVSASIVSTGKTILAMGAAATTFGTASTVGFGKSINAAGDFAETVNMFEAVFKDQSDAVREWGKDYGDVVKRSEAQMLNFLAQSQDTFIPLGFDRNEAADFSKTVTRLAIDLGSFKNIDDGDALRRLLGGLVGNTENLKAFGVQANQAAIKAQALEMGFDPKNLTSYQKAQAILAITIAGTQDAQGDAARTANEYNNSVKGLNASALQLSITIGASLKGAATLGVQGLTSLLNTANDLLERFPILTKLVAAGTIAITAMGAAIVGTAASLFLLSGSIGSIGTFALVSLVRANGVMGTYRIATDLAMSAASRLSTAVGGNAVAMTQAATSGLSLKGRLMLIGASAKNAGGKISGMFAGGVLRSSGRVLMAGFKTAFSFITSGVGMMVSMISSAASKIGAALLGPWALLALAITGATALALAYYKKQERLQQERSESLEAERQQIVAQSFRDAGQPVPQDLSKTLKIGAQGFEKSGFFSWGGKPIDIARPPVVSNGPDGALSQEDRDLADEIQSIKSALESYRQRIEGADRLLARGSISKEQRDKFAASELEKFKKNDPTTQAQDSLRKELMTPMEIFRSSVDNAAKLFAKEPLMFERARAAAEAQFRANDKATQLANQLKTPLEQYKDSIAEARKLFGNSATRRDQAIASADTRLRDARGTAVDKFADDPAKLQQAFDAAGEEYRRAVAEARATFTSDPENLKRALDSAAEQFRSLNPAEQLRLDLRTPAQVFNDRMAEVRKTLAGVAPALRAELLDRATKQARETLESSDTDLARANEIRESNKSDATQAAEDITEAFMLAKKGLLENSDFQEFKRQRAEEFTGEEQRPFADSLQLTSSAIASQIGNFAPSISLDQKNLEVQKKQVELQTAIKLEMIKANKKRGRSFRR